MKIGSLVKYGKWFTGKSRSGLIVQDDPACPGKFFVIWSRGEAEWEDECELELLIGGC